MDEGTLTSLNCHKMIIANKNGNFIESIAGKFKSSPLCWVLKGYKIVAVNSILAKHTEQCSQTNCFSLEWSFKCLPKFCLVTLRSQIEHYFLSFWALFWCFLAILDTVLLFFDTLLPFIDTFLSFFDTFWSF